MIRSEEGRGGYIAGGTFLGMARRVPYDYLVDITGLGLGRIRQEQGEIHLGATATIQELATSAIVEAPHLHLLGQAARSVAGRQIRNMATVAGYLISGHLLADLPAALLVMKAELITVEAGEGFGSQRGFGIEEKSGIEERRVLLENYYADRSLQERRKRGWLVTEVVFPAPPPESRGIFIKFARTQNDVAIANLACLARVHQGHFVEVRLALSAAVKRPVRLMAVERFLQGQPAVGQTYREAAGMAIGKLSLLENVRASRAYRAEVIPVLVRRALRACAEGHEATVAGTGGQH
jgi:carbon-monoxide dehydrogenase medium subunit